MRGRKRRKRTGVWERGCVRRITRSSLEPAAANAMRTATLPLSGVVQKVSWPLWWVESCLPPHPALSLGEREPSSSAFEEPYATDFSEACRGAPSPWGRGRGEGEGGNRLLSGDNMIGTAIHSTCPTGFTRIARMTAK